MQSPLHSISVLRKASGIHALRAASRTAARSQQPTPKSFTTTTLATKLSLVSNDGVMFQASHQRNTCQHRFMSSPSSLAQASESRIVSKDGVEGRPIDFDVQAKIEGNESQIVTITLEPDQVLRAESGAMMYMTQGVEMSTTTGGGVSSGFQRMLTGQNFFISDYRYTGEPGTTGQVALGTDFPSKIVRLNVPEYGGKIICQKGALLCASHNIDVQMEFSKNLTTGFFGGEGFILQGLTGDGDVFVKAGGTLIRRELRPGEKLRISSGCLVAFSNGVDYDVEMIKSFANVFAGGEGLFMTTLTGGGNGGTVWLQGQPPERMISEISRRAAGGPRFGVTLGEGSGGGSGSGESKQ